MTATDHTSGLWRRLVAFALFALVLLTALAVASSSKAAIESPPPPQVWSDQADYAPGESVTLSGANWAAGESVQIRVNDDAGQTWSRDVDVTAAGDGTISDQFNLPNWFVATYNVTATGASSGTATWSFTDGNVEYTLNRYPSTGNQDVNANSSVSFTVGGRKQGGGADPVVDGIDVLALAGTTGTSGCAGAGTQIPDSWLSITSPTLPQTLSSSTTFTDFTVKVSPPTTASSGIYTGQVKFTVSAGGAGGGFNLCLNVISDTTPPVITPTVTGTLGSNGWYTSNVSVSWTVTDPDSTVTSTSGCGTSNVTSDTTGVTFTCTATSAGGTASNPVTIKRDATAPVISDLGPTPASPNGTNGWYTVDVSNKFKATDATSGLSTSCVTSFPLGSGENVQSKTTSGEGSAVKVTSDSCSDQAGNTRAGLDSASFKIDKTAPTVTVSPDRAADHNGWYNHAVVFSAAATNNGPSSAGSCDADETYSGPDSASANVSMDCTDGAGNTGTGSASFQYDATDPSVSATPSRSPDHNGWYNHAFSVAYSGTDDTSDIDVCDADDNYSGPDTSSGSVSGSCTDNAGNSGSASYSFQYDATNPTINATLTPAANGNGWNNTDVNVDFTCSDNLSSIDPAYGCPADQTLTSEGLHTLHVATADDAGNVVTPSFDVRIDKTNPTITGSASPAPNSYGWNNTNVTVSFSCADGLSGLDSCESDQVLSSEGAGQSVTGQAKDKAGNQASATASGINIDKTKPVVAVTAVSNGAVYTLGSAPAAGCSTSDALSGVKNAATLSSSGGPVGSITASCNGAEDKAGNTNSASVTYTVVYNFTGFFAPIDNPPICNIVKAGSAIPVKFSLHGYQGMNILAAGSPVSQVGTCAGLTSDQIEETMTAGQSSLNYDATADQYVYVWKTDKNWAGTARLLTVTLADGTKHLARFSFTR